ncbi:unnamed protein product [Alopecurus aequalis]
MSCLLIVQPKKMQVLLQLILSLVLLAAQCAPGTAVPSAQCERKCGNVEIPYPFGMDLNCSLSKRFQINCTVQDGIFKPFRGSFEVLSISLTQGTTRVLNYIAGVCYNTSNQSMELFGRSGYIGSPSSIYQLSDVQNRFTVIGCNALFSISDPNGTHYEGYGAATCRNQSDLVDGSCSGIGCSQTTIPKRMYYYKTRYYTSYNTSQIWKFNRCSYAVLMEAASFNFSTKYISTNTFNDTYEGRVPMVVDWAVRYAESCDVAKLNKTGYACLSTNSKCVDSTNDQGYRCNCTDGYGGNPYLPSGCIAEGLSFLHSYASPPIIHGDVKTSNILLDDNYMAKVSDFGASILAPSDKEQFVTMVQGTCGYLDPEYMQTCQLTDKSDVYSFGVILLEILTGQLPLKLDESEKQKSLSLIFLSAMKANNLDAVLASHVKGQESMELLRGFADLANNCLDMCGDNRPSMKEVADELNRLRKLSLHPWVPVDVAMGAESPLGGESTSSYNIELSGYLVSEIEDQPINPRTSYYAR